MSPLSDVVVPVTLVDREVLARIRHCEAQCRDGSGERTRGTGGGIPFEKEEEPHALGGCSLTLKCPRSEGVCSAKRARIPFFYAEHRQPGHIVLASSARGALPGTAKGTGARWAHGKNVTYPEGLHTTF